MYKSLAATVLSASALIAAPAAQAGDISWSIGISAPGIGTVISNAPSYARSYYAPVPVYAPEPYYAPVRSYAPQVVYAPEVYYSPDAYYSPEVYYSPEPYHVRQPVRRVAPPVVYGPQRGPTYRPAPVVYTRSYRDRDDRHHGKRHGRSDDKQGNWRDR
ncbi:MAG: hypothetical protein ABIQ60_14375 [Burkholderiaceae bacterium]